MQLQHLKTFIRENKKAFITSVIVGLIFLTTGFVGVAHGMAVKKKVRLSHAYVQARQQEKITVDEVSGWMTFDYLNYTFKLPPEYLKETLHINSPKYPNVQVAGYAKQSRIEKSAFLESLKSAIQNYGDAR